MWEWILLNNITDLLNLELKDIWTQTYKDEFPCFTLSENVTVHKGWDTTGTFFHLGKAIMRCWTICSGSFSKVNMSAKPPSIFRTGPKPIWVLMLSLYVTLICTECTVIHLCCSCPPPLLCLDSPFPLQSCLSFCYDPVTFWCE